jgi:hypothetical protein
VRVLDAVKPGLGDGFHFQLAVHLLRVVGNNNLKPGILSLAIKVKILGAAPPRHVSHMLDVMRTTQKRLDRRGHRCWDILVEKQLHAARSGGCT